MSTIAWKTSGTSMWVCADGRVTSTTGTVITENARKMVSSKQPGGGAGGVDYWVVGDTSLLSTVVRVMQESHPKNRFHADYEGQYSGMVLEINYREAEDSGAADLKIMTGCALYHIDTVESGGKFYAAKTEEYFNRHEGGIGSGGDFALSYMLASPRHTPYFAVEHAGKIDVYTGRTVSQETYDVSYYLRGL